MKIRPVGAELFHTDGRTDGRRDRQTGVHDEANSRFSQLCERAHDTAANAVIQHAWTAEVIKRTLHNYCIKYTADILLLVINNIFIVK